MMISETCSSCKSSHLEQFTQEKSGIKAFLFSQVSSATKVNQRKLEHNLILSDLLWIKPGFLFFSGADIKAWIPKWKQVTRLSGYAVLTKIIVNVTLMQVCLAHR